MHIEKVSVVVPVYQSANSLPDLFGRLGAVFDKLTCGLELICVDDNSKDDSWGTLKRLKEESEFSVKLLRLRKNAGQHNAITAGLSQVTGDVVVTMDDDLQNPPEEIPKLLQAIYEDHDIAIGAYIAKQHHSARNFSSEIVDCVLRFMFDLPKGFKLTSFRAIRRDIINQVNSMGAVFPYVTAMILNQSSDCVNVPVEHVPRTHGKSNYNIWKSLKLVANLLLSYSNIPVLMVGILCLLGLTFSVSLGFWVLVQTVLSGSSVPGWASTLTVISVFNSMMLFCMFIFSVYISRISRQIVGSRTNFVVAEFDYD